MSVVTCDRKPWRGRGAQVQLVIGGQGDNSVSRTLTEVYQVVTNNPQDSMVVVLDSTLVPQLGLSVHPDYPMALCTAVGAVQDSNNALSWYVTVTYTTIQPRQPDDDPLSRPDVVRWTSQPLRQRLLYAIDGGIEDIDGNSVKAGLGDSIPVCNAAGDLFDPPVEDDGFDLIATVQRNVPYVPQWAIDYPAFPASVNEAPLQFGGLQMDTATLIMFPPEISELKVESQIAYYELTLKLGYRPDGWDWRIPNMGFNQVDSNGENKTKIVSAKTGLPFSDPQQLDENGQAMLGVNIFASRVCVFQRPRDDFSVIRLPAR